MADFDFDFSRMKKPATVVVAQGEAEPGVLPEINKTRKLISCPEPKRARLANPDVSSPL
jgi:hypothetical protein